MYCAAFSGQSSCTTQSSAEKSSPRAATSVASNTASSRSTKSLYTARRFICFMRPCRHMTEMPGCIFEKSRKTKFTCWQDDMKIRVLECRCDLMNDQHTDSFCARSHTT